MASAMNVEGVCGPWGVGAPPSSLPFCPVGGLPGQGAGDHFSAISPQRAGLAPLIGCPLPPLELGPELMNVGNSVGG